MKVLMLSLSAIIATALAGPVTAQTNGDASLTAQDSDTHGTYVADAEGRTLYLFTSDEQGQGNTQAKSTCYQECASAWPPHTAEGQPQVGEQLDQELIGTLERDDGVSQVTYGGWPLYYFVKDQAPGDVNGQDVHGFDGEWYLVSPDGSKNDKQ